MAASTQPKKAEEVSFSNDIVPMFFKWKSNMMWRLDLTNYEDVKMNAHIIYDQILNQNMPPPPFPPLTTPQIELFNQWIQGKYQP